MIPLSTALSRAFTFSSTWRGFELKQNDQIVATLRSDLSLADARILAPDVVSYLRERSNHSRTARS